MLTLRCRSRRGLRDAATQALKVGTPVCWDHQPYANQPRPTWIPNLDIADRLSRLPLRPAAYRLPPLGPPSGQ